MCERSVEGLHALVKRSVQRAPCHRISYLSLEMRLPQLIYFAVNDPQGFSMVEQEYPTLSTLKGFRHAVMSLERLPMARGARGMYVII